MNEPSIRELTAEIVAWADSAFPKRTVQSALIKFFSEIGELADDPSKPGEYADVCILVFDLAAMHGVDLAQAIRDKLAINKGRDWVEMPTGVFRHRDPLSEALAHAQEQVSLAFDEVPGYLSACPVLKTCYELGVADRRADREMDPPWQEGERHRDELADVLRRTYISRANTPDVTEAYAAYRLGYQNHPGEPSA